MRRISFTVLLLCAFFFMLANADYQSRKRHKRASSDSVAVDKAMKRDSLGREIIDTTTMDSLQLAIYRHNKTIDDSIHLIQPNVIEPVQKLKTHHFGSKNPRLHTDEVLIALSINAATDTNAQLALDQLEKLRGCQVHSSVMLSSVDTKVFKKLGIELTCEPVH